MATEATEDGQEELLLLSSEEKSATTCSSLMRLRLWDCRILEEGGPLARWRRLTGTPVTEAEDDVRPVEARLVLPEPPPPLWVPDFEPPPSLADVSCLVPVVDAAAKVREAMKEEVPTPARTIINLQS